VQPTPAFWSSHESRRATKLLPLGPGQVAGVEPSSQFAPPVGRLPSGQGLQASVESQVGGSQTSEVIVRTVWTKPVEHVARLLPAATHVTEAAFGTLSHSVQVLPSCESAPKYPPAQVHVCPRLGAVASTQSDAVVAQGEPLQPSMSSQVSEPEFGVTAS